MVFVKVRETYDLKTIKNKMSVIAIHTPRPQIIKANFPGLLMQCRAYRPYSCDVRVACASVLPVDPLGVGTAEGAVAPEDLFNPILYKAMSNFGMSQLEARINYLVHGTSIVPGGSDLSGPSATVDVDSLTSETDEFGVYYGILSNAHNWKHANPQSGLEMNGLRPLVYEVLYNMGDSQGPNGGVTVNSPAPDGSAVSMYAQGIRGNGKPLPMINCTAYADPLSQNPFTTEGNPEGLPGFHEVDVPWINAVVGAIIVPPSKLHELFYRMVVEWTIEFSSIRPLSEVSSWSGLAGMAGLTHFQNYDYSETKKAVTGSDETVMDQDTSMVAANVDIKKVM